MIPSDIARYVYQLDTRGYAVIKDVVPEYQFVQALKLVKKHLKNDVGYKFGFMHLDNLFLDLMQIPIVLKICDWVFNSYFRMDHAFGTMQVKATGHMAHGGAFSGSGMHAWTSRGMRPVCHGQLSCSIPLIAQGRHFGGVAFLPGSHHSLWPGDGKTIAKDLYENTVSYWDAPLLAPGDVLLFPECVVHGCMPWTGPSPRLSLYYMYTPAHTTWKRWDEELFKRARTGQEKRLLRAPYVGNFDDRVSFFAGNKYPGQTLSSEPFTDS